LLQELNEEEEWLLEMLQKCRLFVTRKWKWGLFKIL